MPRRDSSNRAKRGRSAKPATMFHVRGGRRRARSRLSRSRGGGSRAADHGTTLYYMGRAQKRAIFQSAKLFTRPVCACIVRTMLQFSQAFEEGVTHT